MDGVVQDERRRESPTPSPKNKSPKNKSPEMEALKAALLELSRGLRQTEVSRGGPGFGLRVMVQKSEDGSAEGSPAENEPRVETN